MNLVQITPGAGGMYCGNCFRDNALVAALRRQGHEVLMVPLYLPMTLDEESQAAGVPTFFGGINVYLQQQSAFFRRAPKWLHSLLDSPFLLSLPPVAPPRPVPPTWASSPCPCCAARRGIRRANSTNCSRG